MEKGSFLKMTPLKKKMMTIDLVLLIVSVFFFLYISPSTETRPRLIYILTQTVLCGACVFTSRLLIGVYKEYFHDVNGGMYSRVYIHLVIADFIALVVYYLIQHLLPAGPIRVTLVRAVCIVGFDLLEAIVCRLCYQSGFEQRRSAEERAILDAVSRSSRSLEEILEFLK